MEHRTLVLYMSLLNNHPLHVRWASRSTVPGFCQLDNRSAIDRLGVDVELRDIFESPEYRDELIKARGRATVPVLRITSPDGEERWMPESRDIVRYLETTFG